jgi:hypothetical protein
MIRRLALSFAILAAAAVPGLSQSSTPAMTVAKTAQHATTPARDSIDCPAIMANIHAAIQAHIADGTLDSTAVANLHAALMAAHNAGTMGGANSAAADSVHAALRAAFMGPNSNMQLDSTAHAHIAAAIHGAIMCAGKM